MTPLPVTKTSQALRDIQEIGNYLADRSLTAAVKWLDELDDFFVQIATTPGMGTDRSEYSPGLRCVPFGSYLVFFKKVRGALRIARVIHGSRQWHKLI